MFLNEKTLIDTIEKGAKATLKLTLVSNIRNAVMEILKNHEEMPNNIQSVLMTMIPLAMCQLDGEINVTFTDFDEVKDHPMSAPLSINLQQFVDQQTGNQKFELSNPQNIKIDMD
jgi:hypothetical protein